MKIMVAVAPARDLAQHLAGALGEPQRAAELEARLARIPNLPSSPDFAPFLLTRAPTATALLALHLDDLALVHRAVAGIPAATAALTTLLEALRAPLRRTGATPQQITELLADLPADLLSPRAATPPSSASTAAPQATPRLLGYAGTGPLGGWLRVVAVRTLVARRRATAPAGADDDAAVADLAAPDDPELALLRRTYAAEFRTAFATAISSLAADDRLLLRQHHVDGLNIDRLAALHNCHRATAARRLSTARTTVFESVRRRLLSDLRIGGETFNSLLRLVQSELDLSIHRYL